MVQQAFPTIQGQHFSWANVRPSADIFDGDTFQTADWSAVDWDDSLTPGKVKGVGAIIIGRTFGEHDANASMTMYVQKAVEFQRRLLAAAALKGHQAIGSVPFDLFVALEPRDGEGEVIRLKLVAARIMTRTFKSAPGPDALTIEMPLSIVRVELDGMSLA